MPARSGAGAAAGKKWLDLAGEFDLARALCANYGFRVVPSGTGRY
jgi:hypothetical protein